MIVATLLLPATTTESAFNFQVQLEGVVYDFTFHWNTRDAHWYVDIADAEGNAIASGFKVVADWPLLKGIAQGARPPGEVVAFDSTGEGDPTLEELGERVLLLYAESA